jgi:hypothetical protein
VRSELAAWGEVFRKAVATLLLGALVACDVPTDLPLWDTLWVVPGDSTVIPVAPLLPATVTVAAVGDEFDIDIPDAAFSRMLGEMCAPCAMLPGGIFVLKPEFTATIDGAVDLPAEVISAEVIAGELHLSLHHTFSFDPLRPGGVERGFLILEASSQGTTLARDSLNGSATAFPPGTVLRRSLSLGAATVTDPLAVSLTLHSPAGELTPIDPAQELTVEVDADDVRVSDLRLSFDSRSVTSNPAELDFEDVEEGVINRLQGGAVRLDIGNPFEVSGPSELRITSLAGTIVKPLELASGSSMIRIPFTPEELGTILGQPEVWLEVRGTLGTPAAGADLRPGDEIVFRASLEATVRTGEE